MSQVFNGRPVVAEQVLRALSAQYKLNSSEDLYILRIFERAHCEFHGTEDTHGRPEADHKEYVNSGIFPYYVLRQYMEHIGEEPLSPSTI